MIMIYRKGDHKPRKLSKAKAADLARALELRSKVKRPALIELMTSGGFYELPLIPPAVIKDRPTRILEHSNAGWELPSSDLKNGIAEDEQSMAISVSIWIKKHLSDVVDPSDVSVVVE